MLDNPDTSIVEMDTVEGKKGEKVLLTGRTRIFFCNPGASYQKGSIEKNHEFIRYVIPKGVSMDNLTQEDITKMINHINSLTRISLNNSTTYDLAQILLHKDV